MLPAYADFVRVYPASGVFEAGAGVCHSMAGGESAYLTYPQPPRCASRARRTAPMTQ